MNRRVFILLSLTMGFFSIIILNQERRFHLYLKRQNDIEELLSSKEKGRRNTYCDFIQHLEIEHEISIIEQAECINDNTDIDQLREELGSGKVY
ncbi:MAG: hypothetical protein ACTSQE_07420 [Candidatus Heimdallarchaeaceae archaeon]